VVNLEAVITYESTHEIHAQILGRPQTGIQAFCLLITGSIVSPPIRRRQRV
jgi:hypothetical protein